jgi:hypothetical protein
LHVKVFPSFLHSPLLPSPYLNYPCKACQNNQKKERLTRWLIIMIIINRIPRLPPLQKPHPPLHEKGIPTPDPASSASGRAELAPLLPGQDQGTDWEDVFEEGGFLAEESGGLSTGQ